MDRRGRSPEPEDAPAPAGALGAPAHPLSAASDEEIRAALEDVSVPALVAATVYTTGDTRLLRGPLRPRTFVPNDFQGGLGADDLAALRADCLSALAAYRDSGCPAPPPPRRETLLETMAWIACEDVPDDYADMFIEEMDIEGADPRRIPMTSRARPGDGSHHVLVVGAGQSGILAGVRLKQAGIPFTIVDRNPGPGGTWRENTYPGCRVDVGNHFYCYSFEANTEFSEYYSRQPELLAYFEDVLHRRGLADHVEWSTEVVSAEWHDGDAGWRVVTAGPDGTRTERRAWAVICAVGQLNRPYVPDIPGLDAFIGPVFHTARWDHSVDLDGKRVAMIGAGASGFQVGPAIAEQVAALAVFQRSAQWMAPNRRYRQPVGPGSRWALRNVPGYRAWYRFMLLYQASDKALELVRIDPRWPGLPDSANRLSHERRQGLVRWMTSQVGDDPGLLAKVIPDYPPMGKRMLQDDGSWLRCLRRDHVELVRDPIDRIEPDAVCTAARRYPADVIVMATGFETDRLLAPMHIVGRHGAVLAERWGDAPSAHLGVTVPGFPNLFVMYGPGTNLAHAGSIIFHSECQMQFIGLCLAQLLASGRRTIEVRPDAHDAYRDRLQRELATTVWAHESVRHSWYKGPDGKVYVLSPWRLVDYWRMTKVPAWEDYVLT